LGRRLQFSLTVSVLVGRISIRVSAEGKPHQGSLEQEVWQQLSGLVNIFIVPLMSIVPALLYLKMRQLGGETLAEVLAQIEDVDAEGSQWQQRMRTRLNLHTPRSNTPRTPFRLEKGMIAWISITGSAS
jgi:hypothetical protein